MKLSDEQRKAAFDAAQPLIKWLADNCHPHVCAIVDSECLQLFEGLSTQCTPEYIKD